MRCSSSAPRPPTTSRASPSRPAPSRRSWTICPARTRRRCHRRRSPSTSRWRGRSPSPWSRDGSLPPRCTRAGWASTRPRWRAWRPAPRDLWGVTALFRSRSADGRPRRFWDAAALDGFRMTFPARVRVRLRDGRELVASADVPRGGAGHPTEDPDTVSRDKLRAWGPSLWGAEGTAAIAAAIDVDDDRLPDLLAGAAVAQRAP